MNSSIAAVIDSNFSSLCRVAASLTGSEAKNCGYYSWARNPFDGWFSRVFNLAIPSSVAKSEIASLCSLIERGEVPELLIVTETEDNAHLRAVLASSGFQLFYEQTGMAIELAQFCPHNHGKAHDIRQIKTLAEFDGWNDAAEQVFGKRKSVDLYARFLQDEAFALFACFEQDKIIATTMLYMPDEIAGVHIVGTIPEARGKGIGRQITCAAFEYAVAKGAKTGVLQASPMGKVVYESIGFQAFTHISHWKYAKNGNT